MWSCTPEKSATVHQPSCSAGGPDFDHSYLLPELDRLSDVLHLIYYDQRGRGRSAVGLKPEDVTLASDIADMEKVRHYFKLDSVVLLGHSWGTMLTLEYAVRYPQRVSRMILINPAPAPADDYKQLLKEWLETRPDDTVRKKAIAVSAAYQEGDPDEVTAYYRLHFKRFRPNRELRKVHAQTEGKLH